MHRRNPDKVFPPGNASFLLALPAGQLFVYPASACSGSAWRTGKRIGFLPVHLVREALMHELEEEFRPSA
jgi:hypothetical protein